MPTQDATYVALLRGINVGGKNVLPMKDLVGLFERAGGRAVRHYIQSGNVVFVSRADGGEKVARAVERAIERERGFKAPVIVRSHAEMRQVAGANPFLDAPDIVDPKTLHVAFLRQSPPREAAAKLDPRRSPPDAFVIRGREIYLRLPNGVARSKLTNAYFDGALETTSTLRNWATVLKLVAIAEEGAA